MEISDLCIPNYFENTKIFLTILAINAMINQQLLTDYLGFPLSLRLHYANQTINEN